MVDPHRSADVTVDPAGDATRWSRSERVLGLVLALCFGGAILWVAHPFYDEVNDAALYVLTGRSLATGAGYTYLGQPFVVRPPGFAALLTPFLTGESADFALLNGLVAAFGALGAWLVFALFRPRLGGPLAAALAAAVWLNPAWQRISSQVLSDVPGATLCLAVLVLERRAQERPSRTRHALVGLALAAAIWLRTMNVLLVPALALGRWLGAPSPGPRRRDGSARAGGRLAVALGLALASFAPWVLRNASVTSPDRPEQLLLHSYWTALWHVDPGDPGSARISLADFAQRSARQLDETAIVLGRRMAETGDVRAARLVAAALLALLVLELVRRRSAVELVTAAFAAVLVAYFVLRPRLVLPLWLLCVPIGVQGLVGLAELATRTARARAWIRGAATLAVLALAFADARPRVWLEDVEALDRDRRAAARALRAEVPPGAAAVAVRGWHWGVHTLDRPIWSVQYLAKRSGPVEALTTIANREGARVCALDTSTPVGAALVRELAASGPPLARHGRFALFRLRP